VIEPNPFELVVQCSRLIDVEKDIPLPRALAIAVQEPDTYNLHSIGGELYSDVVGAADRSGRDDLHHSLGRIRERLERTRAWRDCPAGCRNLVPDRLFATQSALASFSALRSHRVEIRLHQTIVRGAVRRELGVERTSCLGHSTLAWVEPGYYEHAGRLTVDQVAGEIRPVFGQERNNLPHVPGPRARVKSLVASHAPRGRTS
jgi:hypothetical protein